MKRLSLGLAAAAALIVAAPVEAAEYPEADYTITISDNVVTVSQVITVGGTGALPTTTFYVYLDTVPQPTGGGEVLIGTGTVDADGNFTQDVTVPSNLGPGDYAGRLVAEYPVLNPTAESIQPMAPDSEFRQLSYVLIVNDSGTLPVVGGGDPFPALRLAAGLVVAGAAVVSTVVRRRRLAA